MIRQRWKCDCGRRINVIDGKVSTQCSICRAKNLRRPKPEASNPEYRVGKVALEKLRRLPRTLSSGQVVDLMQRVAM